MYSKIVPCFLVIAASACMPTLGPVAYVASLPPAQEGTFTCAYRTLNEMGFTVTDVDQSAGFIAAEKWLESPYRIHDKLTVSVYDAPAGDTRTLRVTALHPPHGEKSSNSAPSAHGRAAARIVTETCAPGSAPVQHRASNATQDQAALGR